MSATIIVSGGRADYWQQVQVGPSNPSPHYQSFHSYRTGLFRRPAFVPSYELVDGVFVNRARGRRAEAVEGCWFAMIQIGQTKHSATVVRINLNLPVTTASYAAGLQLRHRPVGAIQALTLDLGEGGF